MNDVQLIELIYKAAVNDDWQSVASAFSKAGGDILTHMYGHDTSINKLNLAAYTGYDPDMVATYDQYYHTINSWIPGIAKSVVGKASYGQSYCPNDIFEGSEFYNDWIRPQGDAKAGGGIVLFNDAKRFVLFGGQIRSKDKDKKEKAWIDLVDRMGPHLRHAFEFQRVLQGEKLVSRGYLDVIEMIGNAVFLVDGRGRVQFQNKAAAKLFCDQKIFYLDTSGALRFRDARSDEVFRAGVMAISRKDLTVYQGVFPIRRTDSKRPLLAMLAPFILEQDKTTMFADFISEKIPVAILTVHDHGGSIQSAQDGLAAMFGLTPAEIELALALCAGSTINDHAEQRQTSIHTVRTQLRSLFDKTGARRQAELVMMIGRLVN